MSSELIRKKFLEYFQKRSHTLVSSSPVVPHDDPTLLFCNAGMNQFKDIFLGKGTHSYTQAVTAQKCIRAGGKHNDLDNVGHTSRHLTFFEMLGNFSFGDYFKKEAIKFAWEVATEVFEFDDKRIYPTVFREDDEAFELWKQYVPTERITRMDEKDNFWMMGETGPCGPCSELYYDRGEAFGSGSSPGNDPTGERYLEFWNLVFMQYNRFSDGRVEELAKQSIDTGSGLERVMSLKMEVKSVFETDIFLHLIAAISRLSSVPYNFQEKTAASFHVIADHLRMLSFAIADGAVPSNIERGYVLRKILRRAVRYGKVLGFEGPFLAKLLPSLIEVMGSYYGELKTHESRIAEILTVEEEAFWRVLGRGGRMLLDICNAAKSKNRPILGQEAFSLKDTYGMPIDEIRLLAHDEGLTIDEKRFNELEKAARELSRKNHKKIAQVASFSELEKLGDEFKSDFIGYEKLESYSKVLALFQTNTSVEELKEGESGFVLLDKTPFYSEKGGQIADTGFLSSPDCSARVKDVQSPHPHLILHTVEVERGQLNVGDQIEAQINKERRRKVAAAHSTTHLLHYVLAKVLGNHVEQKGSLVDEDSFRFDFSHHKALTQEQIEQIEKQVNEMVIAGLEVNTKELAYSEIQKDNSIKQFFADKYGEKVRVVSIGPSRELCGGTHLKNTSEAAQFIILSESSVAAGIRRIEACVGMKAYLNGQKKRATLDLLCAQLKVASDQLPEKVMSLNKEINELKKEILEEKKRALAKLASKFVSQSSQKLGSTNYLEIINEVQLGEMTLLAELLGSFDGIAVIVSQEKQKISLLIRCGKEAAHLNFNAQALLQAVSPLIEARGGGSATQAQAGGKKPEGLEMMLLALREKVKTHAT